MPIFMLFVKVKEPFLLMPPSWGIRMNIMTFIYRFLFMFRCIYMADLRMKLTLLFFLLPFSAKPSPPWLPNSVTVTPWTSMIQVLSTRKFLPLVVVVEAEAEAVVAVVVVAEEVEVAEVLEDKNIQLLLRMLLCMSPGMIFS